MSDQVKYTQKLKGAKVLIFGGSSGIGAGVAEAILESGGTAIISSSSEQKLQKKISQLLESYPSAKDRISGHACNLKDEANLEKNIKEVFEKTGGKLDHVVFTAGDALAHKSISEIDFEFVKTAGMVRFFSALFVGKIAPQYLNAGPQASIILTTGSVSEKPIPSWTVINSYATGLQGMTRGLALDLKPIRVNLVSPGYVDTELWDSIPGMDAAAKQSHFAEAGKALPTGKVGTVSDIVESYLYLMKDTNITGTMISTNGGTLLK